MARYIEIKKIRATEAGLDLPRRVSKDEKNIMFFEDDLLMIGSDTQVVANQLGGKFISENEAVKLIEKNY